MSATQTQHKLHVVNRGRLGIEILLDGSYVDNFCAKGFKAFVRNDIKLERNVPYEIEILRLSPHQKHKARRNSIRVDVRRVIHVYASTPEYSEQWTITRCPDGYRGVSLCYVLPKPVGLCFEYPAAHQPERTYYGGAFKLVFKRVKGKRLTQQLLREAGVSV